MRLEPLSLEHAPALVDAGSGFDWAWLSRDLPTVDAMNSWIKEALKSQEAFLEYPFVVYHILEKRIVGSTRYMDVRATQRGVEIGWTWYAPSVWGTKVNPESKYLLLRHAFEEWGAIRVQLKTDNLNRHSQNAIVKLGAKFEGELRNHAIRRDGSFRNSMMYSITAEEWPFVKTSLEQRT